MKKFLAAIVAVMLSAGTSFAGGDIAPVAQVSPASDSSDFYLGLGAGTNWTYHKGDFDFSNTVVGESYVNPVIGLKGGYEFYKVGDFGFAVEGRVLSTINADYFDTSVYSLYIKPEYYIGDTGYGVYGLIGASHLRFNDGTGSENANSFSFGLGAEYQITKRISVSADWTSNMWNKDVLGGKDINDDTVMVWVNFKF